MKTSLQVIIFCFISSLALKAQYVAEIPDSSKVEALKTYVKLRTIDGIRYDGFLIEQNSSFIRLSDIDRKESYQIPLDSIKEISYDRWDSNNDYHYNLQASRYFFGPNAFGLKKGEGYYQNNWVFLNQVSVGLSDRFSIGVGTVPLFIFGLGAPSPVWFTPKFSFPLADDRFNIALGGLFGTIVGSDYNNTFGIAYGAFTLGDRDRNINLSVGYGMFDGEWSELPTISLSGLARVNRKFFLISENFFIADVAIASFGGRTVWNDVSLDYGLGFVIPTDDLFYDEYFGIPWLGITVPFKL